ncbi:hypothetical protein SAMN02746041_00778 [Desulfacinum hydrothermale DSM 13146]|uniref:Uncharacterized protein n=1 Tax=Desulfacinum hydrothermale DSM 13146 TaxID=1121390 RepID=A0A1W1X803_9BACT|nr:hypothetical protein [Desulfacinum hydrothermale]SMC19993.1 hypothetical protein SAMN02746041_00778 [Desulfacinum hydrothermale DSM 13146]
MKPILFFVISFLGMLFIASQTSKQRSMNGIPGSAEAAEEAKVSKEEGGGQEAAPSTESEAKPHLEEEPEEVSPPEGPPVDRPHGQTAASGEESMEQDWLEKLVHLFSPHLPAGVELVGRQTKNYVALTLDNNPRRWVCRLYMKRSSPAIEIYGRPKMALGSEDSPEKLEEQLMRALKKRLG